MRIINEVILAKVTNHSATQVLMKIKRIDSNDLKRILVAEAFGSHLNKNNAKRIGLIPDVKNKRITYIGNAALSDATMTLKSKKRARKVSKKPESWNSQPTQTSNQGP